MFLQTCLVRYRTIVWVDRGKKSTAEESDGGSKLLKEDTWIELERVEIDME